MSNERTKHGYTKGSHFRSEEMVLYEIYFETPCAYECVAELGELGVVHFKDVSTFQNRW